MKKTKIQSQNFCTQSHNIIKSLNPTYITFLKNNIQQLLTGQTSNIIKNLYNLKNNIHLDTIQYKLLELKYNPQYKIPNYQEIFLYAIKNDNNIINHFTSHELKHIESLLTKSLLIFDNDPLSYKFKTIFYKSITHNHNILSSKYIELFFHKLLINDFTSLDTIYNIYKTLTHLIKFTFNYKQIKNYEVFVFINNKTILTSRYINNLGKQLYKRIFFFNDLLNVNTLPNKLIIFMSDLEKEIDNTVCNQKYFKTNNVNSAVTNKTDIIIYRKEELLKSIFHELIHFHNLDTTNIPQEIINNLQNTHNIDISNKYLLYECITESLANIFNIIFTTKSINQFKSFLLDEILFSTLQISKILKICNYHNWQEFTLQKYNKQPKKYFKQDSCIFSYYILKLYILLNLDNYLQNCLTSQFKFISSPNNFKQLLNIFNIARLNKDLETTINILLKKLPTYNYNKSIHKFKKIQKTLRMTCLDN